MKLSTFGGHPIAKVGLSESSVRSSSARPNNVISKLNDLGIQDFEQLYALSLNERRRGLLQEQLNVTDVLFNKLIKESVQSIDDFTRNRIESLSEIDFPTGAFRPEEKTVVDLFEIYVPPSPEGVGSEIAKNTIAKSLASARISAGPPPITQVNYARQLPRARNQADRGTCVSFAVTCINEFASQHAGQYPDLSEQHLYFETKAIDGSPHLCGTWISNACQVLATTGQCQETVWSYNPNPPCNQIGKPATAGPDASSFVRNSIQLNPNNVNVIKSFIAGRKLVAFAIPVFPSWINSGETARSGRITMPLPGEMETGGHAMAMVGYQDEPTYPGGGYFILRNSWGEQWAAENVYAPGYGIIPYAFIARYNWEAFAMA